MYLAELNIVNFRGIKNARLVFKRSTLLIGPNNVGKTTILEAAALLLGRDRMVINLNEWDFFNGRMFQEDVNYPDEPVKATESDVEERDKDADDLQDNGHSDKNDNTSLTPLRIRISGVLAGLSKDERREIGRASGRERV